MGKKLYTLPNTDALGRVLAWESTSRIGGVVYAPPTSAHPAPRLILPPEAAPFAHPAILANNTNAMFLWAVAPLQIIGQKIEWQSDPSEEYGRYPEQGTFAQRGAEGEISFAGAYHSEGSRGSYTFMPPFASAAGAFFYDPKIPDTLQGLKTRFRMGAWQETVMARAGEAVGSAGCSTNLSLTERIDPLLDAGKPRDSSAACDFRMTAALLGFPNLTPGTKISIWATLTTRNDDEGRLFPLPGYPPPTEFPAFGAATVPVKLMAYEIPGGIGDYDGDRPLGAGEELRNHGLPKEIPLNAGSMSASQWVDLTVPPSKLLALAIELPIATTGDASGILNRINIAAGAFKVQIGHVLEWQRHVSATLSLHGSHGVLIS